MKCTNNQRARALSAENATSEKGQKMTETELYGRAQQLRNMAESANHPMLPKAAKQAINEAANLIAELAKREAIRCREQKTTENQ